MHRWILSVSLLVVLAGIACGLSEAITENTPTHTTTSPYQYIFQIQPDPYKIAVSLDLNHRAEALIQTSGGSISTTDTNGNMFQLDVPAGALVQDTLIRLTPITQISDMPFGSNPVAIQVEPEGLELFEPVTLTINPVQAIPVDQQITFGYQGMGEELFLAPPVVSSQQVKIEIQHFSGYGVTQGLWTDLAPFRERIGGSVEARLQSAIAEYLSHERMKQLLGVNDESPPIDTNIFQQFEELVVKPRIEAASESCGNARLALMTIRQYERQRQLLGLEGEEPGLVNQNLMDTMTSLCMQEEYEACRDEHIIHRIIPAWLSLERMYALFGITSENTSTPALDQAEDYVKRCLSFRLEFHSQAVLDAAEGGGYDSTVDSVSNFQINTLDMTFRATAPLVNTAFDFKSPGCKVTSNRGGGTFTLVNFKYIPDTHSATDTLGYVRDLRVTYLPGNTSESFSVSCGSGAGISSPPTPMWTGIFIPLHSSETDLAGGGYVAENWEVPAGELFASKEWIKENNEINTYEAGTFKLYHTPK